MPIARASTLIHAPVESVWERIRDFGTHASWAHGFTSMKIIGGDGTTVGVIRECIFENGTLLTELLVGHNDREHSLNYELVGDIPWPVYNVCGLIKLHSVTVENITMIERVVHFDTTLGREEADGMKTAFDDMLAKGFKELAAAVE